MAKGKKRGARGPRGMGGAMGGMGGGMGNLLNQMQKLQEDMEKTQAELESEELTITAGGGIVSLVISGQRLSNALRIEEETAPRSRPFLRLSPSIFFFSAAIRSRSW